MEASSSQINMSDLRSDLLPVVWKLSSLQGVSTTRMTGEITFKELAQASFAVRKRASARTPGMPAVIETRMIVFTSVTR